MGKTTKLGARLGSLLLLSILLLTACGGGGGTTTPEADPEVLENQMLAYSSTLRLEADWLWDNATFLTTSTLPTPDPERCKSKDFKHKPVKLDAAKQETDKEAVHAVELLDYVAGLNQSVRTQWNKYCNRETDASSTASFMQSYLSSAYTQLDEVDRIAERRIILATDAGKK